MIFKSIIVPVPGRTGFFRRSKTPAAATTDPVFFAFERKLKLTSLKVIPVSEIETNKYPASGLGSGFRFQFRAHRRVGLRPADQRHAPGDKGATPDPLEPGVKYRLLIEAGKLKAEDEFVPVARRQ